MNIFLKKRQWKISFLLFSGLIVLGSIFYTSSIVEKLALEEEKKVKLWADALTSINSDPNQDITLLTKILEQNETTPIILTNGDGEITDYRNLSLSNKDSEDDLKEALYEMQQSGFHFEIELYGIKSILYYDDSILLKQLAVYPYIQLGLILCLVLLAYIVFSVTKKAEQDQVWVGMSERNGSSAGNADKFTIGMDGTA